MYRETSFGKRIDMIALKRVEEHASTDFCSRIDVFAMSFSSYRILDNYPDSAYFNTSNVPTAPRSFLQDVLNLDCPSKNFDDPAAFYQTPEFLKTNAISTATSFDQTDFALRNPVIQSTAVDTSGECNIFSTETSIDCTKDNTIHELGT